jgi:hypothetical protein
MIFYGSFSRNGVWPMTIDEWTAKGPGVLIAGVLLEEYPVRGAVADTLKIISVTAILLSSSRGEIALPGLRLQPQSLLYSCRQSW